MSNVAEGCGHGDLAGAPSVTAGRVHAASPEESASLPLPPGPRGRRLRNLASHFRAYPEFTEAMNRQFGDVVFYRMPVLGNCCLVFDEKLAGELLEAEVTENGELVRQQISAAVARIPNGGVQTSYGCEHRARSALIGGTFAPERMHLYVDGMVERVCERVDSWRDGDAIDVLDEVLRLCAGFYLDVLLGREAKANVDAALGLRAALKIEWILEQFPLAATLRKLPLPFNRQVERTFAAIDRAISRSLELASNARDPDARFDLVARLYRDRGETGVYSSDDLIRDEVYLVFLAALGPTSHMLACGIEHLARRPDVSRRLEAEVDGTLHGRRIAASDLDRLPWTRAALAETLRMRSAGWVTWKRASADMVIDDWLVPEGTLVHPCFGLACHSPEHYERAGEFLPERWLGESGAVTAGKAGYHPFAVGPRMCPGREFPARLGVLLLAAIAQRWTLERISDRPRPFYYWPVGGPWMVRSPFLMKPRARRR